MTRADRQNSAPMPSLGTTAFAALAGSMLGVCAVLHWAGLLPELIALILGR